MPAIDYAGAREYALNRLDTELLPKLFYHSAAHTRYDVARATERLARLEEIPENDFLLLMTAVYFHDLGFTELKDVTRDAYRELQHEAISAEIARRVLPGYGFSPQDLDAIEGIIMATRLPQTPHNLLEQIMADADLDSIGREDFWSTSAGLRVELAAFGIPHTDYEWYQFQSRFLSGHTYFTQAAHSLRDAGKAHNLLAVRELVALYEQVGHFGTTEERINS